MPQGFYGYRNTAEFSGKLFYGGIAWRAGIY